MVRSAAALLAVLIVPSFAQAQEPEAGEPQAQEPQGTHTVVRGNTLWDLSIQYYQTPWEWRVIFNANRDVVEDPHWIYPGEVLVIPGLPADETAEPMPEAEEPMEPEAEGIPEGLVPFGLRAPRPINEGARTVFYTEDEEPTGGVGGSLATDYVAVNADQVYSAPWLLRGRAMPMSTGTVEGFAEGDDGVSVGELGSKTMTMYDLIRIDMPAPARVGAHLQIFRVPRSIPMVGNVARPVGVATVVTIAEDGVAAEVRKVYGRILPGDLVRPLPEYSGQAGVYPEPISGGSEAMIMGFAGVQEVTDVGHVAFLDLGSDDGVTIGDEFVLYGDAVPAETHGALQVIYTTPSTASARVLNMDDDVWRQGTIVRLARKMR
jgi:LysM repeat protein